MMNNNKILTVSYGTFSCTLEGFDDSFGTMKAIAEYFRDLASDDRYFGAEPPQPDAEMLARIAQKEVSRRVHAHERDGKIVLSALEDGTAVAAPAAAVAAAAVQPQAAPVAADPEDKDTHTVEEDEPTEALSVDADEDAEEIKAPTVEDIADEASFDIADLDLAEADLTEAGADGVEESVVETDAPATESDAAETVEVDTFDAEIAGTDFVEDENDIVPGQRDADVEAFFDQAQDPQEASDQDDHITEAAPAPATESIAAKLQRIRAVVARHDDEDEDEDFSEDEHAEASAAPAVTTASDAAVPATPARNVVEDARRDIEDALQADETADLQAAEAEADGVTDAEIDDIADILRRLESDDAAPVVEEAAASAPVEADPVVAPAAKAPEASEPSKQAAQDDGIALKNVFEDDTVAAAPDAVEAATVVGNVVASKGLRIETTTRDASPDAPRGPRARVIKVKRADLEAAIESGDLEEYDESEDQDAPLSLDDLAPSRTANSSLSAEDEDELARELAALEADMEAPEAYEIEEDAVEDRFEETNDDATEDTIAAALAELEQAPKPAEPKQSLRQKLPAMDQGEDADISRLLAEADSQMDEPESATRRDAFAHLRAAVAAKKADQALGSDETSKTDDAYRNDLADVVRPRRPVSGEARTKRPGEGRPAPLKLVAEQRIDVAQAAKPAGPVSPRRVAKASPAPEAADSSFVDFANEMGATKLPDLLEAAAAYMSFVEGRENFSRPQLMSKVRQAGPDGFNREDTLRSFGKLLREGKIEKIKAGQFSASEEIGFHPSRRAVG